MKTCVVARMCTADEPKHIASSTPISPLLLLSSTKKFLGAVLGTDRTLYLLALCAKLVRNCANALKFIRGWPRPAAADQPNNLAEGHPLS